MADIVVTGEMAKRILYVTLHIIWGVLLTSYYILLEIYYLVTPQKKKSLRGWHVLVTGAGRGLGRELALCFAKEGCRVTCVDIDLEGCEETARIINDSHPEQGHAYKLDVTNREEVNRFSKRVEDDVAPVDVLVNNAGIVHGDGLLTTSDDEIERIMNVNTMSHFWTIKAFLPRMKKQRRGHIVAVSSVAAMTAAANIAPYTASKCAVTGLMMCLREELRKINSEVQTTVVQPFFISPWNNVRHWELKTVIPDVSAASVAAQAVEGMRRNRFQVTKPTYLYFTSHIIKLLPAAAADVWRDLFAANIGKLGNSLS